MQNKRRINSQKFSKIGLIQKHINNNLKNYVIVTIIFLVGVILGVVYINNVNEAQGEEISTYIQDFVDRSKDNASIDYFKLFISSVRSNLSLAILLWFAGLTVIGVFVVYGTICFRGFCFGYSISSIIATLGIRNGSAFIITSMLMQNIVFIPTIFALAISRNKAL